MRPPEHAPPGRPPNWRVNPQPDRSGRFHWLAWGRAGRQSASASSHPEAVAQARAAMMVLDRCAPDVIAGGRGPAAAR
jgi:hypothetical protein